MDNAVMICSGILYLYFVSGILLSITQLPGFVSTGLSLAGQLKKKKNTQNTKL